jgi:hypothetical protein
LTLCRSPQESFFQRQRQRVQKSAESKKWNFKKFQEFSRKSKNLRNQKSDGNKSYCGVIWSGFPVVGGATLCRHVYQLFGEKQNNFLKQCISCM